MTCGHHITQKEGDHWLCAWIRMMKIRDETTKDHQRDSTTPKFHYINTAKTCPLIQGHPKPSQPVNLTSPCTPIFSPWRWQLHLSMPKNISFGNMPNPPAKLHLASTRIQTSSPAHAAAFCPALKALTSLMSMPTASGTSPLAPPNTSFTL